MSYKPCVLLLTAAMLLASCRNAPIDEKASGLDQEGASLEHQEEAIEVADYEENCLLDPPTPVPETQPREPPSAISLVFKMVPEKLSQFVQLQSKTSGDCIVPLIGAADSADPQMGLLASIAGATIEPTFGCAVLSSGDLKDWRLGYWTIRFPRPPNEDAEAAVRERVQKFNAKWAERIQAEVTPAARAPGAHDPYVGAGAEDEASFNPKTRCGTQWYHYVTNVTQAWKQPGSVWPPKRDESGKRTGPVVFVADFGFYLHHRELDGVLEPDKGWNTCTEESKVDEGNEVYHGTAVVGLLAAKRDGRGIMGVAHDAEVWPIQATCGAKKRAAGEPWPKAVDRVIRESRTEGRRKILLLEVETQGEYNYEAHSKAFRDAIIKAIEGNVVVITTAGNAGVDVSLREDKTHTEEHSGSIVVGATSYGSIKRAKTSNYGDWVVVSAPGDKGHDVSLLSTGPSSYYPGVGGTSGAAAKVAGVVALMLAANPDLTPACVEEILRCSGTEVKSESDKKVGSFLNASAAIKRAKIQNPCPCVKGG